MTIADIIRFLVVLGLVIVVHEWGHLIVAKLVGARVERFSIGFGRRLCGITWHGTEYIISALPLGGYVKIRGMEPDDELTGAPWEFLSLSAWRRIAVVFAGPAMNFVLAIAIYYVLFIAVGEPVINTTTIGLVQEGGVGWEIGLRTGDRIVEVNGEPVSTWDAFSKLTGESPLDEMTLTVDRAGERLNKILAPPPPIDTLETKLTEDEMKQRLDLDGLVVRTVQRDSPAAEAGLVPGSVITVVNGEPMHSARELAQRISEQYTQEADGAFKAKPVHLAWLDLDNQLQETDVHPTLFYPEPDAVPYRPRARIGVVFTPEETVRDVLIPFHARLDVAPRLEPNVGVAKEGGPAREAGIVPGSRITDINGKEIDDWNVLMDLVLSSYRVEGDEARGIPLEVTWITPDQEVKTETIVPKVRAETIPSRRGLTTGEKVYVSQLGLSRQTERIRYGVIGAAPKACEKLRNICGMMFYFIYKVVTGEYSSRNLGGPVAIAQLAAETGRWGLEKFFDFIALLSANLAILNLLIIPPLDGGHVILYVFQGLRKRPVTLKQMETFGKIGIMLIIPLMLYFFLNDLERVGLFRWMKDLFQTIWPQA
ncbi:MAG: site-2 protease family protein [bacterium]